MEDFFIRLFITIGLVWLVDYILAKLGIEPMKKNLISAVALLVLLVWLFFGNLIFPVR